MTELPGEKVEVEGTEVYVHPVQHTDATMPIYQPSDEMREYVHDAVTSYEREGAAVYMEQNLPEEYGLDDGTVTEIDDHDWAADEYTVQWSEHQKSRKKAFWMNMGKTLVMPFVAAPKLMIEGMKEEVLGEEYIEKKRKEQEERMEPLRYLTDPDALDEYVSHLNDEQADPLEERDRLWEDDPEQAVVRSERSRYIAETVASAVDGDEAHVIVGGGHYSGVLQWLDEYSDGTDTQPEDVNDSHAYAEGFDL
ncbi:MAG: hypothetical protein MUP66_01825 [Candidatus Nanohaloarchaeota archaeon QJJ-5]|nr:hypothetical protein [Candidatus Nanohaloarchaeota archaeon QJJ-5]